MDENSNILIRIREINEISFTLRQISLPVEEIIFGENLSFGLGFDFKVNVEKNELDFKSSLKYIIKGIENPVVELETEIAFEIKDMLKVVQTNEEGQLQINDEFLVTLAGISIGTTRGMLAANTKGSQMAKFPMPILNPKEILDQMNEQSGA